METPIKNKASFFPKLFRVFSIYIFITLAVFFGYVQIFGHVEPAKITLPTGGVSANDDDKFGSFVSNMMSMKSLDMKNLNLQFVSSDGSFDLAVKGNVAVSVEDMAISIDLDLIYNDTTFDVGAVYKDSNIFLNIEDKTYKYDLSDIDFASMLNFDFSSFDIASIDFDQIFGLINQYLGIDKSKIENVLSSIGIDINNFDVSKLMEKGKITSEENEDGTYRFIIEIANVVSVVISTDENFDITGVRMDDVLILGNSLKFSIEEILMNDESIAMSIQEPEEFVDLTGLTPYFGYAKNLLQSNVAIDFDVVVGTDEYQAHALVDLTEGAKVEMTSSVEGFDISVVYADQTIFVDVDNLALSFNVEDIEKWKNKFESLIEKYTSKSAKDVALALIEKIKETANVDFDLNLDSIEQIALNKLSDALAGSEIIATYMPSTFEETEFSYKLIWENGLSLKLEQNEEVLSGLVAEYENIKVQIDFAQSEEKVVVENQHYDLDTLFGFVEFAERAYDAMKLEGTIDVSYGEINASAKFVVDLQQRLICLTIENDLKDIEIYLSEAGAFVAIDEIVVEVEFEELQEYLAKIEEVFGVEIPEFEIPSLEDLKNINIDVDEILANARNILETLKLSNDGEITLIEYLTHKVKAFASKDVLNVEYQNGDVAVSANVVVSDKQVELPVATDNLSSIFEKIENTKQYVESKLYAFDFEVSYKNIVLSGRVKIDLENKIFDVLNIEIGGHTINLHYADNVVYVEYANNKIQIKIEKVEELVAVIQSIVEFDTSMPTIDVEQVLEEVFGENILSLEIVELLNKIEFDLKGTLDDLTILLNTKTQKERNAKIEVGFEENKLDFVKVETSGSSTELMILDYAAEDYVASEYYDILTAQQGTAKVKFGDVEVEFEIKLDLNGKLYLDANATILGEKLEIVVANNKVTASIGEIVVGTDLRDIEGIVEFVVQNFGVEMPKVDTDIDIETLLETIDLNGFDVLATNGLDFTIDANGISVAYQNGDIEISAQLTQGDVDVKEVSNYEEIESVLEKAKNIKNLIDNKIVEFDFDVSYNGFEIPGTFKFDGSVVEITAVAAGEDVYIRVEDKILYFAYGNMKLKFDIPESNGTSTDFSQTLKDLLNDNLPVRVRLGVFEDLVRTICDFEIADYLENMVVDLNGTTDNIALALSKQGEFALSKIANVKVSFEENKLDKVVVDVLDILKANLSFNHVENSTIREFNVEEYQQYSANFVDGLFDSMKVKENVYALSSDIAIRYSRTTFKGELVAMVKYDENAETLLGHYVPAVRIKTSALGFSSYIYVVENTAYIDIQGLQISADLSKNTLDEVLNFVDETFGIKLLEEDENADENLGEVFKILLPAIDKIYASWARYVEQNISYNGVEIKINDSLWYSASARFEDMILQAFIENYDNVIVPRRVVFGADVYDANTIVYDNYDEYLLENELPETATLNFAVYLSNVSVGRFIGAGLDCFVKDANGNIVAVESNYGTTNLSDFNSYEDVLKMVETIWDYANSFKYQGSVKASIKDSANKETKLGAEVNIEIGDLSENESNSSVFKLFDDKYLKVQGAIDLKANSVEHLFNVFYESKNTGALYATYTHSPYLNGGSSIKQKIANASHTFKAKIANTNLSDIFSMVAKFANIDLGDEMMENLGMTECQTDFRFVQSLIGMEQTEVTDPTTQTDKILSSVEDIAKIIKNVKLETTAQSTILTISVDIEKNGNVGTLSIVLNNEAEGQKLRKIVATNIIFGGNTFNLEIDFEDFVASNFDYNTANHIDVSEISSFIDTAVSTLNTKNWAFKGSTTVYLGSSYSVNVGFDIFAQLDENNEIYLYVELDVQYKDDVTGSAQINPDYTSYILAGGSYDKRTSILEYKNGYLTIVQKTYGIKTTAITSDSKKYDQIRGYGHGDNWIYSKDQIADNAMKIMAQALGLSRIVYGIIEYAVSKVEATPTIEEAFLGFSKNANGYAIKVNAENLMGMSGVEDLTLNIGTSKAYNVKINGVTSAHKFIDSITTELKIASIIRIPVTLSSVSGTSYRTADNKEIYTNDYYRKIYAEQIKTLRFDTNCNQYVSAIVGPADEEIALPTLENFTTDDGICKKDYTFAGWWTTPDFANGTQYLSSLMPQNDTTLYAKWQIAPTYYRSVSYQTNSKYSLENVYALDGSTFVLPTLETYVVDDGITKTTRVFAGWYEDANLTNKVDIGLVKSQDSTLYAKWNDFVEYYRTISFVTNSDATANSITKLVGEDVTLPTLKQKQETIGNITTFYSFGGWFTTENFEDGTEFTSTTMPSVDTTLFAKWNVERVEKSYQINLIDNGNVVDTIRAVAGDEFTFSGLNGVCSTTKYYVDQNFTTELDSYVMPEKDLNVYLRNQYSVTYNYYVIRNGALVLENAKQTLYQGTALAYPTNVGTEFGYIDYKNSSNQLDYRLYYYYSVYKHGDDDAYDAMPNYDYEITGTYTTTRKNYYTISFDMKLDYIPKLCAAGCKYDSTPSTPSSLRLLEGSVVDLTRSEYQITAKICATAVGWTKYTYKSTTWGTSKHSDYSDGGDGVTSWIVTGNATLKPYWKKQ